MRRIIVRCDAPRFHGRTFTHGREYVATQTAAIGGRSYSVLDDLGLERYISPDEPSAHLPPPLAEFSRIMLGRFVTVD